MGKFTRLGAVMAASASMVLAPMASADTAPYPDQGDWKWYGLETIDGNNKIFRAAGRDRVETAIQLMCHATNHKWKGVIIARSDDFADALASGPLADVNDFALLVMPSGVVDARVLAAINSDCNAYRNDGRTNIKSIVLVGGTGVWTEGQREYIYEKTGIHAWRVSGIDRYDTAVAVAQAVAWTTCYGETWLTQWGNWKPVNGVPPFMQACEWNMNAYVATGADFPDALAAGAAAAANEGVVLLTKGYEMDPRGRTLAFLDNEVEWMPPHWMNHVEIHSVGGPADAALRAADVRIDFSHVGKNRYGTAVKLAQAYDQVARSYTLASGENYPDAVIGGAFAANHDGPLLLTRNTFLSPETKNYLRLESNLHATVMVVGGIDSVTRGVSQEVWDALHY